jgi:hypothetical protein
MTLEQGLAESLKDALDKVPEEVLDMKASDFLMRCEED